jgi:DNA modification methylase
MAKLNNRNFIGFDINQEYIDLANKRVEGVTPHCEENPNPKKKFIVSK